MELVKYEAACRAVAEARTVDEVKEIVSRAEAARAYARQAKNRQMEIDAIEIRTRAERKLGEIIVALKKEGAVGQGRERALRLPDLGIDMNISAGAQRLALLPEAQFEGEMQAWRGTAEYSRNLTVPLQRFRNPSAVGDRQKATQRLGRSNIDQTDTFGAFVAPDGRRVADWRIGELDRLRQLFSRAADTAAALIELSPVANADPLATVQMVFKAEELLSLLEEKWSALPKSTGLDQIRVDAVKVKRRRLCLNCGCEFQAHNPSGRARRGESREGLYCSRVCAGEGRAGLKAAG